MNASNNDCKIMPDAVEDDDCSYVKLKREKERERK